MKKILGISLLSWVFGVALTLGAFCFIAAYGDRGASLLYQAWSALIFVAIIFDFINESKEMKLSSWLLTFGGVFLFVCVTKVVFGDPVKAINEWKTLFAAKPNLRFF